jgi:hypothetical protein
MLRKLNQFIIFDLVGQKFDVDLVLPQFDLPVPAILQFVHLFTDLLLFALMIYVCYCDCKSIVV